MKTFRFALALLGVLALFVVSDSIGSTLPDTVRVVEHGTRYHALGCPAMRSGPGTLVRRTAADSAGFVPCRRCLLKSPRKASRFARLVLVQP